jgi:ADP-heptose:LPS heptosyltransferase
MHFFKLRIINSKFLLGICKQKYNIYDISVNIDYNVEHISKIYVEILHSLNIKNMNTNYDIFLDNKYKEYAKTIIERNNNEKYIFFNTHSASKWRSLSLDKTNEILQMLYEQNFKIILNSQYDINNERIIVPRKDNFLYVLALVKNSDIILTTNTSIIHAANAFDKKMIAIYNNDLMNEEKISKVWAPNYQNGIQILSKPKKGINSIEISQIADAMKKLLN